MPKARGFGSLNPRKGKDGKTKYYPFYRHNMKRHRAGQGFTKKQTAEAWLAAEYRLIELDAWTPPETRRKQAEVAPLTVGQWLKQFQDIVAKKVKPSTLDNYKRVENNRILNVP